MKPWSERSVELANLLNPAFGGFLIRAATLSYSDYRADGMPFALAFLILPLVLHMDTRNSLPRSVATTLISWLQTNPEARVGFDVRMRSLNPFTRESVTFVLRHRLVNLSSEGTLRIGDGKLVGKQTVVDSTIRSSEETAACVAKAQFLGRWLAQSGDVATIYALFGIRP